MAGCKGDDVEDKASESFYKQTHNPKNDEKHDSYFSLKLPLLCRIISGNALHQSGLTVAMRIKPQNAN
jgi:hypothetical protein